MATRPAHTERIVTATELRRNFKSVVRRLRKTRSHAIIQSGGEPVAVMLSMEEYQRLTEGERRQQAMTAFKEFSRHLGREVERQGLTEEELMADLEVTKREVFEEKYGRPATKASSTHRR